MQSSTEHAVVIAGGGPTGLMLAGELALAGIDVAIVERRATQDVEGSRALGLQSRSIEMLDQRGIANRFLAAGYTAQTQYLGATQLDISDFPTRHNYGLALPQQPVERLLAEWVAEFSVPIYRSCDVTTFVDSDTRVDVTLSDGRHINAQYLVGCDGGRSVVRKTAGIAFVGSDATTSWMMAEVETTETPRLGFFTDAAGRVHAIGKSESGKPRMVLMEPNADASADPTIDDLRKLLVEIYSTDFGARNATWISRFNDMSRQAARYRKGRVLVAGDAANVRAPLGGQGLGIGMYDAVNLGWKLAQVVKGTSPDSLLDTYHDERHPATARVLQAVLAQVATRRVDAPGKALTALVAKLLAYDGPRKEIAGLMSGLDVRYDLGEGHPLLGRRMPDLDVTIDGRTAPVYRLLRSGRPILIDFEESTDIGAWSERVYGVRARFDGRWQLPVIGEVDSPTAVLVRPDGHVAWVGERGSQAGLRDAIARWF